MHQSLRREQQDRNKNLGIFHTSSANMIYKVLKLFFFSLSKILMDVLTSLNASFSPLSTEFSKSPDFLLELPR